jgi:TfoX/Sxy family transcriptional regulator of competence genes
MRQGKEFVQDIEEILYPLATRSLPMFGAYGLYCDEKFVVIIGDDQVYIKRSAADPALFEGTEPAPPFEGASDWHLVPEDLIREGEWLREAIQATADALPKPKPKKNKGVK